jgi:hypothetical protein
MQAGRTETDFVGNGVIAQVPTELIAVTSSVL